MNDILDPESANVAESQQFGSGSDQERAALDKAYKLQSDLQKLLTSLEEQMVPAGFATPVPEEYGDLPQLRGGRAVVEFVLNKPNGAPFDVEGVNFDQAKMTMVIGEYVLFIRVVCLYVVLCCIVLFVCMYVYCAI